MVQFVAALPQFAVILPEIDADQIAAKNAGVLCPPADMVDILEAIVVLGQVIDRRDTHDLDAVLTTAVGDRFRVILRHFGEVFRIVPFVQFDMTNAKKPAGDFGKSRAVSVPLSDSECRLQELMATEMVGSDRSASWVSCTAELVLSTAHPDLWGKSLNRRESSVDESPGQQVFPGCQQKKSPQAIHLRTF